MVIGYSYLRKGIPLPAPRSSLRDTLYIRITVREAPRLLFKHYSGYVCEAALG